MKVVATPQGLLRTEDQRNQDLHDKHKYIDIDIV